MKNIIFFYLVIFFIGCEDNSPIDPIIKDKILWLQNNATVINSVNPNDEDYSDLFPLKNAIGNAQVVMLGEQSHGDGTTFLMKTRLIKYLHEQMGFNVLLFESGLFDCKKINDYFINNTPYLDAVRKGIYPLWTESEQFQSLINYLGENYQTIEIGGFDSKFTGEASQEALLIELKDYLNRINISYDTIPNWDNFESILQNLTDLYYNNNQKPNIESIDAFHNSLDQIVYQLERLSLYNPSKETNFWIQMLTTIKSEAGRVWDFYSYDNYLDIPIEIWNIREELMGENIIWHAKTNYPNSKIIVWAASSHISKSTKSIEGDVIPIGSKPMGQVVNDSIASDIFVIGFTAYEGSYGTAFMAETLALEKPSENSFEDLIYRANIENAFINFRVKGNGDWILEKNIARPFGYGEMKANWSEIFDGLIYTQTMVPSKRINY